MQHLQDQKLRDSLREYLAKIPWERPVALSLTLKQRIEGQQISLYAATSNFRHFMNRLNRFAFGNAARRYGKGLRVMPVLEHDELVRFHHHATIDQPAHLEFDQFKTAVETCWLDTAWGYQQMFIVPVTDLSGWNGYLTKANQKQQFDLAIDWINTRSN